MNAPTVPQWMGTESFSEMVFRKTGARWPFWFALGFTLGFTFAGVIQ